jgi:hypothetical protein
MSVIKLYGSLALPSLGKRFKSRDARLNFLSAPTVKIDSGLFLDVLRTHLLTGFRFTGI